jgi:hypothetical protein
MGMRKFKSCCTGWLSKNRAENRAVVVICGDLDLVATTTGQPT